MVAVFALGFVLWALSLLRPWVAPGASVFLLKTNIGVDEIQIWQTKTEWLLEPFLTKLFLKHHTNDWALYIIDHQDIYRPRLKLTRSNNILTIVSGEKPVAYLDLSTASFYKSRKNGPFIPMGVVGEPPGHR